MDLGITGKRALVLGASSGIGRGIAEALAAEGVVVALAARRQDKLNEVAEGIRTRGGKATSLMLDLADRKAVGQVHEQVQRELGGIDILVNNTGGPPPGGVAGRGLDVWQAQFEAMVLSVIELTDLVLPGMRERKWGRIMTIGSAGVVQPMTAIGLSNVLRAMLAGWSKTLAGEVAADGVTVNMLHPATTLTDRIRSFWQMDAERSGKSLEQIEAEAASSFPTGRYGTIEEFGAVAAFLASQQAAYITGSMIRVDGGFISAL